MKLYRNVQCDEEFLETPNSQPIYLFLEPEEPIMMICVSYDHTPMKEENEILDSFFFFLFYIYILDYYWSRVILFRTQG